uniref:SPIN-DOC-like zinc-finger domain-containing protein n=1 Tax=Hippocampus comes TaxID=109280 RepID=A0A3Q2Y521_HIPCM
MAKRKKEYGTLQDEWTEGFAFVEGTVSPVCLICNDKIPSMKQSNLKRHFDMRHVTFASKYAAGDSRKEACKLLSRVQARQRQLRIWTRQADYNSASFAGSLAIMRNGKPFTLMVSIITLFKSIHSECTLMQPTKSLGLPCIAVKRDSKQKDEVKAATTAIVNTVQCNNVPLAVQ